MRGLYLVLGVGRPAGGTAGGLPGGSTPRGGTAGAGRGGPSGSTSTQRTASVAEVCRKFNFSECRFKACKFAHHCATCSGPHPASQCPKPPTTPAEQGANAAPLGPWRRGPQKAGPLLAERTQGLVPPFGCCCVAVVSVLLCWPTHLRFADGICG